MGLLDFLRPKERFSASYSISDPAFAAWLMGNESGSQELVTPYTILGLSAVIRAVSIISTTIAGLPLRTFERQGADRVRVPSEFDDPYPGPDGLTPFAWAETVLIHLLIWRRAFLWHEARADGSPGIAYRPVNPDYFKPVKRVNGRYVFEYLAPGTTEVQEVGSETVTFIAGPSVDGVDGLALLWPARAVFSAALSGDRTMQRFLRRGIRLGGLVSPADGEEDFQPEEGDAILANLRASVVGSENAGDVALINRKLKLQNWTQTNIDAQWDQNLSRVLMQIEQLFGVVPHLMADTERQTSWGTGVAEQNLGFSRFTLRGWSDRMEQVFTRRVPGGSISPRDGTRFVEFDYAGLLQGTPAEEIGLLINQIDAGLLTIDEARQIRNLPPLTPAQKAELVLRGQVRTVVSDQNASTPTPRGTP